MKTMLMALLLTGCGLDVGEQVPNTYHEATPKPDDAGVKDPYPPYPPPGQGEADPRLFLDGGAPPSL